MVDSDDQRDFRRMPIDCGATLRVIGEEALQNASVNNLSATGMLLRCEQRYKEGELLEVDIRPPNDRNAPFRAIVEVLRVDGPQEDGFHQLGCGIKELIS